MENNSNIENEDKSNSTKNNDISYPSAEIFLQITKSEYDIERNRKTSVENRTMAFIAFVGSLFFYVLGNSNYVNNIFRWIRYENFNQYQLLVLIADVIIKIICMIALIYAVRCFIKVMSVDKYQCFPIEYFLNETKRNKEYMLQALGKKYCDVILQNRKNNQNKTGYYCQGLKSLIVSVAILIIDVVFINVAGL